MIYEYYLSILVSKDPGRRRLYNGRGNAEGHSTWVWEETSVGGVSDDTTAESAGLHICSGVNQVSIL